MEPGAASVKLLGMKSSPYVHRVELALKLKMIPYEYHEQHLRVKSELLLQSNPIYKKVPVLLHNDKSICESLLIIQYIDEVWPNHAPALLPSNPHDRALVRFWAAYFDDKWIPMSIELRSAKGAEKEAVVARTVEGLVLLEAAFVKMSKGKAYFGGDNVGLLDIVLGSAVGRIKATEMTLDVNLLDTNKTPALVIWAETFMANDVVKDVLPSIDNVVEMMRRSQARAKAAAAQ